MKKSDVLPCVEIYTDGACLGNPGPGGWAAILKANGHYKEISGGEGYTTNNKMELIAIIKGLELLKKRCNVTVYTDSKYIHDAINKGWLDRWQRTNWMSASKKPVKNRQLWERLVQLFSKHTVEVRWIRGHSGHTENERCDVLARKEALKRKRSK